jgi:hypothetical protein
VTKHGSGEELPLDFLVPCVSRESAEGLQNMFPSYRPRAFLTERFEHCIGDLLFVVLLIFCIAFALGSVASNLEKQQVGVTQRGARTVDAGKIKKQIMDGKLSPRRALYFRKIPR